MSKIYTYNTAVQDLVEQRIKQGQHLIYVPLLHPTDEGYKTMATYWYQSIIDASEQDFISTPVKAGSGSGECATLPTWVAQGTIVNGGGLGKNYYLGQVCAPL
jgi:hypothetical protein